MYKTARQIADQVLSKIALDLSQARGAVKRLFDSGAAIRGTRGVLQTPVGELGSVVARRAKQIPEKYVPVHASVPINKDQFGRVTGPQMSIVGRDVLMPPNVRRLLSPRQKEMSNRIGILHEQSERKAVGDLRHVSDIGKNWGGAYGSTGGPHASPQVLLQEGNLLASLPEEFRRTKRWYQLLRKSPSDASAIELIRRNYPGYEHGVTRMSRHARKRVGETIKKDAPDFVFP